MPESLFNKLAGLRPATSLKTEIALLKFSLLKLLFYGKPPVAALVK